MERVWEGERPRGWEDTRGRGCKGGRVREGTSTGGHKVQG